MEGVIGIIVAPFMMFMIFVAPIWVMLHYRHKAKLIESLNAKDAEHLQELAYQAERMRGRIRSLESILDAGSQPWKDQV